MSRPPRILLFDSGLGGLTVARAVRAILPDAHYLYGADTAAFPYGAWDEPMLVERIVAVMGSLIAAARPDVVVVACNTASTLALARLRAAFALPFVGTVPAIKPAAEQTTSRIIGVLATPGTVNRDYTQTLIHTFAHHCRVILHGAQHLAGMAEAKLRGDAPDLAAILQEIRPVFRLSGGRRTDTVVLGCTHYPLLLAELEAASPWPVTFIDPAPAIARRVASVVKSMPHSGLDGDDPAPDGTVFLTAPRGLLPANLAIYAAHGFERSVVMEMTVGGHSAPNIRSPC